LISAGQLAGRAARWCVFLGAFVAGLAIVVRTLIGPLEFPVRVTTPLNPEGWFGLALTILLATGAGLAVKHQEPAAPPGLWQAAMIAALAGITAVAFRQAPHIYFLADDFVLVSIANKARAVRPLFLAPGGDGFFRPIGYLSLIATSSPPVINAILSRRRLKPRYESSP
jgi:hypothetical protein